MPQETAEERWRPILGVEQILVSVISLFADPNDASPANVDAAVSARARGACTAVPLTSTRRRRRRRQVEWRDNRKEFKRRVRRLVEKSQECSGS